MREYETTIVVQPEISEEGATAILQKLDGVLERGGETRLCVEDLGKRKLAYEINKFHKGHYYVLSFAGTGAAVPELERSLRLDESVLRFLTIMANPELADLEARKAEAKAFEEDQTKRAAEKAAREAEEARARAEAELAAASAAAEEAARAPVAAEAAEPAPVQPAAAPPEAAPPTADEPVADSGGAPAGDEEQTS